MRGYFGGEFRGEDAGCKSLLELLAGPVLRGLVVVPRAAVDDVLELVVLVLDGRVEGRLRLRLAGIGLASCKLCSGHIGRCGCGLRVSNTVRVRGDRHRG